jgi:protein TonB
VVPVKALIVSAVGHLVVVGAFVALALWGMLDRTTVHVVNLFPSIAAVGTPAGSPAALPTRTPPPPAPTRAPEPEPKPREVAKPAEAALPSRTVAPKVGERDLPPPGMPSERRGKASVEPTTRPPAAALGQSTGSVAGQGSMTLDVTDFPHAWYLRQVVQKVEERWQTQNRPNEPGQKPRIYVEIQRDGTIAAPRIEQSSGSSFYDRAALRAISEASPFPPLPADWSKPALRVLFNFELKHG